MLLRVLDLVVPVHAPFAHRGDHLELWRQRRRGDVEAHLVVAFACAAMGDRSRPLTAGDLHQHGRDQRPAEGRRQRVLLLVHGSGLQRRPDEELQEGLAAVRHVGGGCAGLEGAGLDGVEILLLAEIDREGDDVPARLFQPSDCDRRVEAA